LAYVTGLVNQELLLQNEYLAPENRILKARLRIPDIAKPISVSIEPRQAERGRFAIGVCQQAVGGYGKTAESAADVVDVAHLFGYRDRIARGGQELGIERLRHQVGFAQIEQVA
jgi:hypothetical protein